MREQMELVAAAQAGDREALSQLLAEHRPLVVATCRRMLGDPILVEEALQEASIVVLLNLRTLRRSDRFGPWFTGIALNVCRHLLRDRQRERLFAEPPASGGLDAQADALEALEARLVRNAIATLPSGQRQAVLLYYVAGLTQAEISTHLGIAVGAVKTRLHKARAALRERLSPHLEVHSMTARKPQDHVQMTVTAIRRLRTKGHEHHVLVLSEVGGARSLPIWIGPGEATSIALHLEQVEGLRPTTATLAANLLLAAGGTLREVRIERLDEKVFYAVAVVEGADGVHQVDARPSDAVNMAMLTGSPIAVSESVLSRTEELRASERTALAPEEVAGAPEISAEAVARARAVIGTLVPPELHRDDDQPRRPVS
jgi:RNA polymerase sigma factor (sigma-70 family)